MTFSDFAALAQAQTRTTSCGCPYCAGVSGPIQGCPCAMCQRGRSNMNLSALMGYGVVGGDVRGYGALAYPFAPPPAAPRMGNYGQRSGGCGCNGKR